MRPTVPYLREKFDLFNRQLFEGKLPEIPIQLSKAASYVGMCTYKSRRRPFRGLEYYDFKLRISTRLDLPEAEVEDTIIHEMIHYYIRYNRIQDTSAHGKEFRRIMGEINEKYGRHITISHRSTKEQREEALDKRPRWRVIAIVSFKDGREGLKLLPRVEQRITAYHRAVLGSGQVEHIIYFVENDPWFNRYPTSSAFNVIFAPMDEVRQHLTGKTTLTVTARTVTIHQNVPSR